MQVALSMTCGTLTWIKRYEQRYITPKIENIFISVFRLACSHQESMGNVENKNVPNLRSYHCFIFYKSTQWFPKPRDVSNEKSVPSKQ